MRNRTACIGLSTLLVFGFLALTVSPAQGHSYTKVDPKSVYTCVEAVGAVTAFLLWWGLRP